MMSYELQRMQGDYAYGFSIKMSEADCVAELMRMYQKLTKEK